ncbi:MAG: GNAT family N-acetyltransferase [Bacteroidetes bacterium]|nr:GNAT family N-acetyltransferase [Bacteroidota bacterium]
MNSKYIIRDFSADDIKQINEIWQQTDLGNAERGDNENIINNTIKIGGKFLVLENSEHNEIIGTSWITTDNRRLYLHHFGIKPEYQKKGLGIMLAKASLEFAKKKNMQIKLEVHENNKGAIELYKKLGFKYLGNYKVLIIRDLEKL